MNYIKAKHLGHLNGFLERGYHLCPQILQLAIYPYLLLSFSISLIYLFENNVFDILNITLGGLYI